jgi:predicted MFS family arabinose efflux permease
LWIENDPRDRGLNPDGDSSAPGITQSGTSVREAVRSRRFIGLYAACLTCSFGLFVPFVHLIPYAIDHGARQSSAVLLLGAIGVGSTAGRFFLGGLADRWGRGHALVLMFAGMGASLLIWVCSTQWRSLCLFALLYGGFYGGFVAILPALVMDYFGGRHVSGIIGVLYTSVAFGTLVGPSAAGFAFDISHSYTMPILVGVVANIIAALIIRRISTSARAKSTV